MLVRRRRLKNFASKQKNQAELQQEKEPLFFGRWCWWDDLAMAGDDAEESPSMENFSSLASGECWTLQADVQLVEAMNSLCRALGVEPANMDFRCVCTEEEEEKWITAAKEVACGEAGGQEEAEDDDDKNSKAHDEQQEQDAREKSEVAVFRCASFFSSRGQTALRGISGPQLRARAAVLYSLNRLVARALPYLQLQSTAELRDLIQVLRMDSVSSETADIQTVNSPAVDLPPKPPPLLRSSSDVARGRGGGGGGVGMSGCVVVSSWRRPSTGWRLRQLRSVLLTHTKVTHWGALLEATTTPTPLPQDEYEDPKDIKAIRVNRIKAQPAKLASTVGASARLRRSVFGQLYREMRGWSDTSFRRAYSAKGHGGQRRAFKVKFVGEGVNDYGGPYRAVFEQVGEELQYETAPEADSDVKELALLPLLIPCPNRRAAIGEGQDKFVLNPSALAEDMLRFFGKVLGTAVRHGMQICLDLPAMVWRPLVGLPLCWNHLEEVSFGYK